MTTTTPDRGIVTEWLLGLLAADPNGYGVGDHKAPAGPVTYPYLVVYSIPGGSVGGPPMGQAQGDASFVYQVDSVGLTREQSEKLASRARERVSGRTATGSWFAAATPPSGLAVNDRIAEGSPGAPLAEGSYPNEVWTTSERFVVSVTLA